MEKWLSSTKSIFALNLLKLSAFAVFFSRGWFHITGKTPYWSLIWDEDLLSYFIIDWQSFATSSSWEFFFTVLIYSIGVSFIACALLSLKLEKLTKASKFFYILNGFWLFFYALLSAKDKNGQLAMFTEHMAQSIIPFALYFYIQWKDQNQFWLYILKLCVAVTFVSHGLYALGYYPVPGHFVDMVIVFFSLSEDQAIIFLKIMGTLDIISTILLFIPKTQILALSFMFLWGGATASARILTNLDVLTWSEIWHWSMEFVVRTPHWSLPLLLLIFIFNGSRLQIQKV